MLKNLFRQIQLDPSRIHIPLGTALDLSRECADYEEAIQSLGGIDFQLLGLGSNGHIGFNEPGTHLNSITHVVSLSQETIKANSRFFTNLEEVPKKAITMGIKSIMNTRKILLLVSGEKKAEIIRQALSGPISKEIPASVLQLHPNATVVIDQSIL
jgi:glucosamine-6-phosphate deaminase